jgi:hypothetical protein
MKFFWSVGRSYVPAGGFFCVQPLFAALNSSSLLNFQFALRLLQSAISIRRIAWPRGEGLTGFFTLQRSDSWYTDTVVSCRAPPSGDAWRMTTLLHLSILSPLDDRVPARICADFCQFQDICRPPTRPFSTPRGGVRIRCEKNNLLRLDSLKSVSSGARLYNGLFSATLIQYIACKPNGSLKREK